MTNVNPLKSMFLACQSPHDHLELLARKHRKPNFRTTGSSASTSKPLMCTLTSKS